MPKTYTVTEYDKDDIEAHRTMCVLREIMKHITKASTIPLSCTLQ